ncbi:MAG: glutamine--fructose-6-phosphate transaminase (isomerizing) [Sulfolobales archaeon]|nr:glutamine--fructose-6-phosphate transaminase (isomerizing) [Sulfolobales archaeon]MCX8199419.1 glutamine--fructose-6-phosphate transaminase (isomerizing) [Sulfolobales archaeon]MDW8170266.1 glutamine--fructose-6-phosphate transaminase (isomerizing) [Desulfurococcaceae archaeon]
MGGTLCGIIGLTCIPGSTPDRPSLMVYRGLLRLEYRGYDSAGVASIPTGSSKVVVLKGKGKIIELEKKYGFSKVDGCTIVAHTRWATHGAPTDINAHPHTDCSTTMAIVHNGIIQNYRELRKELVDKGHVFVSETDTEVVPHFIEELYYKYKDIYSAFKKTVEVLEGSYAIALISVVEPDKIFFARKDSPLVLGLGNGFNFVASDIPAFLEYSRKVIVLRDYEVGYITPINVFIEDLRKNRSVGYTHRVRFIEWSIEDASKGGYAHFMIKEIFEQPRALKNTLQGIEGDNSFQKAVEILLDADRIYVTAAGTSYHAGFYYSLLMQELAGTPVVPFIASEHYVYERAASEGDVLIVVSQSGETIDSLMALRAFKERGARVIALSNVIDSAIPRESHLALYTRAGPEIGVAATKTFITQALALAWLAVSYALASGGLSSSEAEGIRGELRDSPRILSELISLVEEKAKMLSEWMSRKSSVYYLSRGIGLPVAMEGALKLKEIAYIHAEAYPAGESKHGPIALVSEGFPVIFVVPTDNYLEKLLLGNVQEMKARGAVAIGVASLKTSLGDQLDYVLPVPRTHWVLTPLTHTLPLQLIAYYTAVARGLDPDKPRNLAKTVTVE